MKDTILFEQAQGTLQATIDNQTKDLNVCKIIKEYTGFLINENIYATLYAPIDINLSLIYFSNTEQNDTPDATIINLPQNIEEEEDIDFVEDGICYLSIKDLNTNKIVDTKTIHFHDGLIQTTMSSDLYLGDYLLEATYPGNKYYEPSSITIQFSITKREVQCTFDEEILFGYPNENMNVNVTISDVLNNKRISNCIINYIFDGIQYTTQTNDIGRATLNFTMPDVNKNNCGLIQLESQNNNETSDDDANVDFFLNDVYVTFDPQSDQREFNDNNESPYTDSSSDPEYTVSIVADEEEDSDIEDDIINYGRPEFELIVTIDNNVYMLREEPHVKVYSKEYNTETAFYANSQDNSRILHIEGNVIAIDDQENTYNVNYGVIDFDIAEVEPHPNTTLEVDENGHFSFDVTVVDSYNAGVPIKQDDEWDMYSLDKQTYITLTNLGESDIFLDDGEKHKVRFKAIVEYDNSPVPYGMVSFSIIKKNKEIYRYVTELNNNGEAFFTFNVSTIGEYQVVAKYHKFFEYQESESNMSKYTVKYSSRYLLGLSLDINKDLAMSFINLDEINNHNLITNISISNGDLIITKEQIENSSDEDIINVIQYIEMDSNGDLITIKEGDTYGVD